MRTYVLRFAWEGKSVFIFNKKKQISKIQDQIKWNSLSVVYLNKYKAHQIIHTD